MDSLVLYHTHHTPHREDHPPGGLSPVTSTHPTPMLAHVLATTTGGDAMKLMTVQEQQDQQQRSQGYFSMPDAPTLQEQLVQVDYAFDNWEGAPHHHCSCDECWPSK